MEYEIADSSGTDDDLPPHQNRVQRGGRVAGSGRSATLGSAPYTRMHNDMETQIHHIEQEAYTSVLRAFKAQSDAITWEKESLITELRKELRVSDEEHRELLGRVNADDVILRIREWRKAGGHQSVHDQVPSTSVPVSRKKQKTSHSMSSLSLNVPSSLQPSSSFAKRGATGQILPSRGLVPNRGSSGAHLANEAGNYDPLVGRKVMTRWPEDKNFYKAVITDYNPVEDLHALVYDINTANEAWEWVNLKEISPDDIRWEGEDPGVSRRGGRVGPGHEIKKSTGRGTALPIAGSGRGFAKGQTSRDNPPSQNGGRKKKSDEIEIFHTDTLIKEVERVFGANHPDAYEITKAKKVLKEHEQALVDAIARLAEVSDGENGEGEHLHGQQQYGGGNQFDNNMVGEGREQQVVN